MAPVHRAETPKKKREPQDLTLRNLRALRTDLETLAQRVHALEAHVKALASIPAAAIVREGTRRTYGD